MQSDWPWAAAQRHREEEVMDSPDLDGERHRRALRGLSRINALSRSGATLWREIEPIAAGRPIRVLDVACGGGDGAVGLWRRAQAAGLRLRVDGLDISPRAIEIARRHARRLGARDVSFGLADVVADPLPAGYDVVTCSLFLHHLEGHEAVRLLARMARAARRRVIVVDLRRGRWGSFLAGSVPRLITRSGVVHTDAVRSARAAFTFREMRRMADRAGLEGARLRRRWPARLVLTWDAS